MQNFKLLPLAALLALCGIIPLVGAQPSPIVGTSSDSRVEITIYSYNTNSTIQYYPYVPENSGYIWAWIDISIKNVGNRTISTNSLYASLKDNQDFIYISRVLPDDPKWVKLQDLSPGSSQRGNFYFEIPSNAKIVSFTWNDYASNIVIDEFPLTALLLGLLLAVSLMLFFAKHRHR